MADPRDPKECCYRTIAGDADAAFCGECGQPILRCMAFEECGGLVGRDGLCHTCVQPVLDLDPSAVKDAQVGSVLTLPLMLKNTSPIGRPLFITALWVRTGDEPRRPVELLWERLDGGAAAPVPARTSVLEQSGTHRIEIAFVAETRYRWRTESFLFAASLEVNVEGDRTGTVHQTINLTADKIEPGATVYAPVRGPQQSTGAGPSHVDLRLVHAERLELEMGLRGVDKVWRLPRDVRLRWRSFDSGEAPNDGPLAARAGVLAIGRTRTKLQGGEGDVRILARDGGGIDEQVSVMISRRHCEVYIQNDRLVVRAESDAGLMVDGDYLSRGDTATIRTGTVISLLKNYPQATALKFDVHCLHGVADEVTVTRLV